MELLNTHTLCGIIGGVFWRFSSKIEFSAMAHHYGWEGGLSPAIYLMVNGGVTFPSSWFYSLAGLLTY